MLRYAIPMISLLTGCLPFLPQQSAPCAMWSQPGTYRMNIDGYVRSPLIYVPATAGPRHAVVMLHGAGGSARTQAWQVSGVLDQAEEHGYVAIFPNGSCAPGGYTWNANGCCGEAQIFQSDDLGFLDAVVQEATDAACVDTVLAAGHSNGAMMALHWACQSAVPSAVLSAMGPLFDLSCPGDPIPVEIIIGKTDKIVPPQGMKGEVGNVIFPPSDKALEPWFERNACKSDKPEVSSFNARISQETWSCAAPLRRLQISDWGHTWPGGRNGNVGGFIVEDDITRMVEQLPAL